MQKKITPCIWFNGQAAEAATVYASVFRNSKILSHSTIVTEINISGQGLILLDGGPKYQPNASISFYYTCEDEKEFNNVWKAFSKEGSVIMPKNKYAWSEMYGWVTDKYGVSWQLTLDKVMGTGEKITPCLMFTGAQCGRAEQAVAHYTEIFKSAEAKIIRYAADELPNKAGTVKLALLTLNGQQFMLMDSALDHDFTFTEGVSLTIYCETQEEIDYYWEQLTEGGAESMCGWLVDKFGVSWQVIPTMLGKLMNDPSKAGKVAKAFMSMRKLVIEQMVQAAV